MNGGGMLKYGRGQWKTVRVRLRTLGVGGIWLSTVEDAYGWYRDCGTEVRRWWDGGRTVWGLPKSIRVQKRYFYCKKFVFFYIVNLPRGVSEPFFQSSGNSVDQFTYQEYCLASLLLPFIKKYHYD